MYATGVEFNAPPTHPTSFQMRSSQSITWQTKNIQNKYNSQKPNNVKYSKTKLPSFSHLLWLSARKRDGLNLYYNAPELTQAKRYIIFPLTFWGRVTGTVGWMIEVKEFEPMSISGLSNARISMRHTAETRPISVTSLK